MAALPAALQQMIDREAIRDLVARYNIAGDRRDLAGFVDTFAEDGEYHSAVFQCIGKAAIRSYMAEAWAATAAAPSPRFRRHNLTTTQIDLTGPDSGEGRLYYLMVTDLGPDHCGYYVDRYRRDASGWRIARREVWMDWALPESLAVPEASKRMVAERGASGPLPPVA